MSRRGSGDGLTRVRNQTFVLVGLGLCAFLGFLAGAAAVILTRELRIGGLLGGAMFLACCTLYFRRPK